MFELCAHASTWEWDGEEKDCNKNMMDEGSTSLYNARAGW